MCSITHYEMPHAALPALQLPHKKGVAHKHDLCHICQPHVSNKAGHLLWNQTTTLKQLNDAPIFSSYDVHLFLGSTGQQIYHATYQFLCCTKKFSPMFSRLITSAEKGVKPESISYLVFFKWKIAQFLNYKNERKRQGTFFFFKSLGMCGVVQYGEINRRMHLKQ